MNCKYCGNTCIKKGWYKDKQRYLCKNCNKYQQMNYKYEREKIDTSQIILFTLEGMSISSTSRVLKVSKTTVQRRLLLAGSKIHKATIKETAQEYEVDEMCTFVGNKRDYNYIYITYAINRHTRRIVDFVVGSRTKEMIAKVISTLLLLSPERIYTDKLNGLLVKNTNKGGRIYTDKLNGLLVKKFVGEEHQQRRELVKNTNKGGGTPTKAGGIATACQEISAVSNQLAQVLRRTTCTSCLLKAILRDTI